MTTTSKRIKAAIQREPGYPVGEPAPCFLICECGKRLYLPGTALPLRCDCGAMYDSAGWRL